VTERPRLDRREGRRLFGLDPETYDTARPGHARDVYDILRERCGMRDGAAVLEVGPGTGQATRRLLELGADPLVAIEPDPALAAYLRRALDHRVEVRESALEDAELEPAAFDLAAAASSFHWVEEEVGLTKLRAALRPGGWIALWWTSVGDEVRPDAFFRALDPLFETLPRGPWSSPDRARNFGRDSELRLAALAAVGFEDREDRLIRWAREWDTAGIRALYSTFSPIRALEPDRREEFLDSVAMIAEDEFGGRVERALITSLYTARKPS
jgi:SAM-dependent methyltransferase